MEEEVALSDPRSVPESDLEFLPYNFLPAALPAIAGVKTARNRIVMTFPKPAKDGKPTDTEMFYSSISADVLARPARTAAFLRRLQEAIGPGFTSQPWFLGPPTTATNASVKVRSLDRKPIELDERSDISAAVVVVDVGIAFWNRRFQDADGPRFHAVRFLDFDPPLDENGTPRPTTLDRNEIIRLCNMAKPGGMGQSVGDADRAIVQELRASFPGSFYGSAAAQDLDGVWHGTAMADLAAGHSGDPGQRIALFGLELPTAMVQDYGGDSLTASLLAMLNAALGMTSAIRGTPVTILLPYAFSGGPHDGTHPAAEVISRFQAVHARAGLNIVVSAGNLLQSQLRAKLPGTRAKGAPLKLDWWEAPDDFSINTVEALIHDVLPTNVQASLDVKAPTNETAMNSGLAEGQSRDILRSGAVVGSIMRFKNNGNTARLRLSLMPSGRRGTEVTTPHGRWVLSTPSTQPADLWILRDDADAIFDQEYPHRQSHFDHQMYRPTNKLGQPGRDDDPGSPLMRSGTLSPLATAPGVAPVQADERLGNAAQMQAEYSGKPDGPAPLNLHYLVDDGWVEAGVPAAANGSDQRVRVSGTSAAAALHVRNIIGLGGPPTL